MCMHIVVLEGSGFFYPDFVCTGLLVPCLATFAETGQGIFPVAKSLFIFGDKNLFALHRPSNKITQNHKNPTDAVVGPKGSRMGAFAQGL